MRYDYLEFFAREHQIIPARKWMKEKLTYLEVDRLANRFANSLLAQGLKR